MLDSGALYRVTGHACLLEGVSWDDDPAVTEIARHLDVSFSGADGEILVAYKGRDVSRLFARKKGAAARLPWPLLPPFARPCWRDSATFSSPPVWWPTAATWGPWFSPLRPSSFSSPRAPEERARRRYKQLIAKGENVSLPRLLEDIKERDERDSSRAVSPLVPAEDAIIIDSSAMPIAEVFAW